MKTIRQHLSELPPPYAEMALEEMEREKNGKDNKLVSCPSLAIGLGFWWGDSKIDRDFWHGIYDNLIHLGK